MKKIIALAAALISCCLYLTAEAQPRAAGLRIGATGFDASYQHSIGNNFVEAEAGLAFGPITPGFKATALYNFVFARPAWTDRGTWGLYAGPGLSLGYVSDRLTYTMLISNEEGMTYRRRIHPVEYGFMMSVAAQIGLEYTFWFPLQLSVDIRPYFGFHVNGNARYSSRVGFYNYGMMGFIPTVSARYSF